MYLSYADYLLLFLKSIALSPAPRPAKIQTINKNNCAPEAIGELNISSSIFDMFSRINRPKDTLDFH